MIDVADRHPVCPLTGEPAKRLIQPVSSKLLSGLWRAGFRVSTTGLLGDVRRFGLWESPCGLAFFDPMIAGDAAFYARLYRRLKLHDVLGGAGVDRPEFLRAAELVPDGALVLDVGGGEGGFRQFLPQARYVGFDPHASAGNAIHAETLPDHARSHAATYDVVCAFQVIEHVADPLDFVRHMVACLKPGGRLIIGVPHWPSPMTAIPNFAFNAPPHHLSWWTAGALRTLAARVGVAADEVGTLRVGSHESVLYWMGRLSPKLTGTRFFRAHWTWYLALAWAWAAGRVADRFLSPPQDAERMILLMAATK